MEKKRNHFASLFFSAFCLFGLSACASSSHSKEELLIGEWQAEWEVKSGMQQESVVNGMTPYMKGKMKFTPDGKVEMIGYGHPGCLFSSDTLSNQLQWQFAGEQLSLLNVNDAFHLKYEIQTLNDSEVRLVWMDDISLKLSR